MSEDDAEILNAADAAAELIAAGDNNVQRYPMGYSIDDCGQLGPGELALLWARSGTGKSTFLLNAISRSGQVPTVVFNMEMTSSRQVEWLTCMTHRLACPARDLDEVLRWPDDPRYESVVEALRSINDYYPWLHFIHPGRPPAVNDFIRWVDRIWDRTGVRPARVFIDHLSLMAGARDYSGVSETAAALHTWAINDGIGVVSVQQTGRSGNEKNRNDGHLPVTLSSGVYAGEHDADFIYGLYRPEKDPKYMDPGNRATVEFDRVRGVTRLQLIKNRPYGELREVGIELTYDVHSRRLHEKDETYSGPALQNQEQE